MYMNTYSDTYTLQEAWPITVVPFCEAVRNHQCPVVSFIQCPAVSLRSEVVQLNVAKQQQVCWQDVVVDGVLLTLYSRVDLHTDVWLLTPVTDHRLPSPVCGFSLAVTEVFVAFIGQKARVHLYRCGYVTSPFVTEDSSAVSSSSTCDRNLSLSL